jgi:hypothetical protein
MEGSCCLTIDLVERNDERRLALLQQADTLDRLLLQTVHD